MASIEAEWIDHDGSGNPLSLPTCIDVLRRNDENRTVMSDEISWTFGHNYDEIHELDVLKYRIHNAFKDAPDEATHLLCDSDGNTTFATKMGDKYTSTKNENWIMDVSPSGFKIIATRKRADKELRTDRSLGKPITTKAGGEYTGGSVSYYTALIDHPTNPDREPYEAECNDIIEALKMNYAEGNAFKAIWRKCAARLGTAKKGYTDGLYDAEKVVFFGERMVEQEKQK